jgi:hypothetical protein
MADYFNDLLSGFRAELLAVLPFGRFFAAYTNLVRWIVADKSVELGWLTWRRKGFFDASIYMWIPSTDCFGLRMIALMLEIEMVIDRSFVTIVRASATMLTAETSGAFGNTSGLPPL